MASAFGVSKDGFQRVWSDYGLKPHRIKTFKISNDPRFAAKLMDVVGLYINLPEHALVLSCDEKSQIQALDRTQNSLPLFCGRLASVFSRTARQKLAGNGASPGSVLTVITLIKRVAER